MPPLLFSIIIPTYNYAEVVTRAIQSVQNQSGADYEIIVINDGSTDQTKTTLEQYNNPQIKVINQTNQGPAATRNNGIQISQGEFLIFLDADDEFTTNALEEYRHVIKSQPKVDVILGGHESVTPNGTVKTYKQAPVSGTPYSLVKDYLITKKIRISNGAIGMRKTVFAKKMFPEHLRNTEDIPIFVHALANFNVGSTPNPVAKIHKHADSLRHNTTHAKHIGTTLVSEIFGKNLPQEVRTLHDTYLIQRHLSLARTFFLSNDPENGQNHYKQALNMDWRVIFKTSYTKKFLLSYLT